MAARAEIRNKFPVDWFPYGAVLTSTMTRWSHYGQDLKTWIAELSSDLTSMARHGMTSAAMLMDWEMVEPAEGQFDFQRYDPIVAKAEKTGLRLVVWPWEEVCPEWVARNHPDWSWEADDQSRPPFGSWLHPGFQGRVHRFLRAVVSRYKTSAAIFMWNVGVEPHYRIPGYGATLSESYDKLYCYQPATLTRFRAWLKQRYQMNLASLNRAWQTYYTSWSEVMPPRYDAYNNLFSVRFLDWRLFWIQALTDYQCGKAACIRQCDPHHPTTGNSGWLGGSVQAGLDVHKVVEGFDSFGVSWFPIYPKRASVRGTHLSYGYIRSACYPRKPFFLHELQGGPPVSGLQIGETPDPREIKQWCWQAIGAGFRGIYYWAWRPHRSGHEAGGFGLTSLDGRDTGRTQSAAEVAAQLQRHAGLLNRLAPVTPQVAILFSQINNILSYSIARTTGGGGVPQHAWALKTYFGALHTLRIPTQIVGDEDLDRLLTGNLRQIKVLIIPYTPIMSAERIAILERYVRQGGIIWSDPWLAQRDEANVCRPACPPAWLGCDQGQVRPIVPPLPINLANRWRGNAIVEKGVCRVTWPARRPARLPSFYHEVSLAARQGAQVIGKFQNGTAGLVRYSHGRGAVFYAGSFFGLAAKNKAPQIGFEEKDAGRRGATSNPDLLAVLRAVLTRAQVVPPIQPAGKEQLRIEASLLTGEKEALAIFINHGARPSHGRWKIYPGCAVNKKTTALDILRDRPLPVGATEQDRLVVPIDLPVYGLAVIRLA